MSASKRGKTSWAKGRSAAIDPRIAKNAGSRRGRKRGPYRVSSPFDTGTSVPAEKQAAYVHLLGLYLGDGSIVSKTARLEIALDSRYPSVIEACADSMRAIHPRGRANLRVKIASCTIVNSYGRQWLALFPQHGPGRKHLRRIVLAEWQRDMILANPIAMIRGLLDSDGSRSDRWVAGRRYPAYYFTNRSEDIIGVFCWVADLLGIHYTRASRKNVSIARRRDVAFLDAQIPQKTTKVISPGDRRQAHEARPPAAL